jgi:transposase
MRLETATTESLPRNVRDYITEITGRNRDLEKENLVLREQLDVLLYKRFGRSAEQLLAEEKQPWLFGEAETQVKEQEEKPGPLETEKIKTYTRNRPGRKAIDPAIPRKEETIDIPEAEKVCACGAALTRIGEEVSEKLEIIPPKIYVRRIIRPKYACRSCEGTYDEEKPAVRMAPVEPAIIPRSIVTPSLLSTIIIQKFEDHLPYYRQERQFERIGVSISRQDMSD